MARVKCLGRISFYFQDEIVETKLYRSKSDRTRIINLFNKRFPKKYNFRYDIVIAPINE